MALPQPSESQNTSQPQSASSNPVATQPKRKPSRRANTAERRATHNAVERQRRETLNGRFLDLAALLPNLSQIRRPSKSAIVNSSIAHVHASRRHRLLASRELRILKLESDALRRELNEWRDRAGLPRVDEPVRGDGFTMVLSGEIEVLAAVGEDEDEGQGQFDGFEDGDEEFSGPMPGTLDDGEDTMAADQLMNGGVFGHNITSGSTNSVDMKMARMLPRTQPTSHGPMIAQITPSVSYENPAMPALYEPQVTPHFSGTAHIGQHGIPTPEADKVSAWAANMYSGYNTQLQVQAQRSMITPPNSAHAVTHSPPSASGAGFSDYAYLANLKRQQMMALQHQHGSMAYAVDGDDASSVGSSELERSGSASAGSGFGSPPRGTTTSGSYELSNAMSDFNLARRIGNAGLNINTAVSGSWNGRGEEGMNGMIMKQAMNSPMHVVPNGGGYGIMM
ncbi:hypothetical protein OG21DRAFT_1477742 [Imleria badia]|nr:hypothetical protein OG21DRAFT_1477742 [Imleria badia]